MHAGDHKRTLTRSELVLNLGLPEVQEHIINSVSNILDNADVAYIKWDNNRGIHEMSRPSDNYAYMLGIYHVIDTLTTKYPEVLWEGCASGGGRFDAGLLHYWPQHWTSDNTDASDRLTIQLGTSLAYPPSAMGCHVSVVPNHLTNRNVSVEYRAHVALMVRTTTQKPTKPHTRNSMLTILQQCGSFGFELRPSDLTPEESAAIPGILADWAEMNPLVINGDFYRLRLPDNSNWPAVQFVSKDGAKSFVLAYQQKASIKPSPPPLKIQGLEAGARYTSNVFNGTLSGRTLMNAGLNLVFPVGDYQSQLVWLWRE
jgi:alpha-galactosidase